MIKRFCDNCTVELTDITNPNRVSDRIQGRVGHIMVEVIVGTDGTWNHGDLCTTCVLDAVAQLTLRKED
jgi:hypothetical protein